MTPHSKLPKPPSHSIIWGFHSMPSEVKHREFCPVLDRTGRPWREDSDWACGMPVGAFRWISHCKSVAKQITCTCNGMLMRAASFVPDSTRSSIQSDDKPRQNVWQDKHIPKSDRAMIVDLYMLGVTARWALLPFRAFRDLEASCVPAAILPRMRASVGAAQAARWRQWFEALDEDQQKAHVQALSETGNNISWAGRWLKYEERLEPGHTPMVATAVRAVAIIDLRFGRLRMKAEEGGLRLRKTREAERDRKREELGLAKHDAPSSAPLTPHDIKTLNIRAPCYFRLPAHAFRFATQIFSGKSYEDAVEEQKANFGSWVREANVCRVIGRPESVVWEDVVVPKGQIWEFEYQEEGEAEKPNATRGQKRARPSDEE